MVAYFITAARAFLRDESGQDLTEYGLLATLIAMVVMAAVGDAGAQLSALWSNIMDQFSALL